MRGKGFSHVFVPMPHGITPAHAGKSHNKTPNVKWEQDHPRTCGEKIDTTPKRLTGGGSPPHMRGKVNFIHPVLIKIRITPAHAGKSNITICKTR